MKRSLTAPRFVVPLLLVLPIGYRVTTWWAPANATPVFDTRMSRAGSELFLHEWTADDPLSGEGDGLGPVFNAASCVACHNQGGPGGGGPLENNVTTFLVRPSGKGSKTRQGVVHSFAAEQSSARLSDNDFLNAFLEPSQSPLLCKYINPSDA